MQLRLIDAEGKEQTKQVQVIVKVLILTNSRTTLQTFV